MGCNYYLSFHKVTAITLITILGNNNYFVYLKEITIILVTFINDFMLLGRVYTSLECGTVGPVFAFMCVFIWNTQFEWFIVVVFYVYW